MKNTGTCPKCGGTEIWIKQGSFNTVYTNIFANMFRQAYVDRYCCMNCGYIEEWAQDLKALRTVKEQIG
jgi:predicted nucleic-acid-binding Zn-ribbon protein